MSKQRSDIFICNLGRSGYWAYPSPFVAHGGGTEIQFRNLTDDAIEVRFERAPLDKAVLELAGKAAGSVTVQHGAAAGLYAYDATVTVASAARRGGKRGARPRKLKVKGGSSPKIIVDA